MIIPAFALLAGASLVGSISGTIAWYQYSTRTNVSYIGTSAGTIGNLQVRLAGGDWGTQISIQDVEDYLLAQGIGQKVEPVTPGALAKDGSLFKASWKQSASASTGTVAPDDGEGSEGDYYYDTQAKKLYEKGENAWALSSLNVAENAPENPNNSDKYFNSTDKKVYEAAFNAEWKQYAVASTGTEAPDDNDGKEGDYYFDTAASKLYRKRSQAWAVVAMTVAADAPENPTLGDKYFNSGDKKVYEAASLQRDFFLNPQIGVGPYKDWLKASTNNYVRLPLQLRFMEQNEEHLNAEDVYLSKLIIQHDTNATRNPDYADEGDLSDAIRVHLSAYEEGDEDNAVNHLISEQGGTTLTHGRLRIGNGADFDKAYIGEDDEFGFKGSKYDYVYYGGKEGVQTSYKNAVDGVAKAYYYEEEFGETGWKEVSVTVAAGVPNNANGNKGDFYRDSETNKFYQKGEAEWAEFTDYANGDDVPNLNTDAGSYKYYVKNDNKKLFLSGAVEEAIDPIVAGESDDASKPLKLTKTDGKVIGQTVETRADDSEPQKYLNVDVTIWVEGWHKFNRNGQYTSLWDRDLIGAQFDVGMQFAVQDR